MTHGGWSLTERPTLAALLAGLRGGMDPTQAYGILSDTLSQHESRRREDLARGEAEQERMRQEEEERQADLEQEQEERQAMLGQLGQLVLEQAQQGRSPQEIQTQLGVIGPVLGVDPAMAGQLEQTVSRAYPRPEFRGDPKVTGGGQQQQTMIRGAQPQVSPLYQPPPQEPLSPAQQVQAYEAAEYDRMGAGVGLPGAQFQALSNVSGIDSNDFASVVPWVERGMARGMSPEQVKGLIRQQVAQIEDPATAMAEQQKLPMYERAVDIMYSQGGGQPTTPQAAPRPRAPVTRPPTNPQALATGAVKGFFG